MMRLCFTAGYGQDPSTSHPPTSPGTRDSNRSSISPASSLPSMSATPSGSTSTTSAASSRSETSRGQESQKSVESASGGVPGAADSNAVKAGVTGGSGAGSMPEGDAAVKSTSTPVGNGVMATGAGVLLPGGLSGTAGLRISVPEENGQLASQESAAGSGANGGDDSATEGRKKGLGDRISGSGASGAPNAQEIIAPQFWLVGDQGVEGSSQVEGREGTGEGAGVQDENDSGEDTSDEAFERRHSVRSRMLSATPRVGATLTARSYLQNVEFSGDCLSMASAASHSLWHLDFPEKGFLPPHPHPMILFSDSPPTNERED